MLVYPLLGTSISTCTFATDGSGDITVGATHGLSAGALVRFDTTGALPTEINLSTQYYVLSSGLTTTKLRIAATAGGSVITFAGAGSGTHTIFKFTVNAVFEPRASQDRFTIHDYAMPGAMTFIRSPLIDTVVGSCSFSGVTVTTTVAHGLTAALAVRFSGALPTGINPNTTYYVLSTGLTTTQFQVSLAVGGAAVDFGPPTGDVTLRNVPFNVARPNDVVLYSVSATVWKTTKFADDQMHMPGYTGFYLAFLWVQNVLRNASEALTISGTITTAIQPTRATATESLSISVTAQGPITATVTETLTIAVAPTFGGQYFRKAVNIYSSNVIDGEFLWLSRLDAIATLPKMRTVAELLSIADFAAQKIGPGLSVAESLATSDVATRRLVALRVIIESLAIADSPFTGTIQTSVRTATESLLISLSVQVGIPVTARGVSEALTLSDNVSRILQAFRGSTESLLIADSPTLTHFGFGVFAFESLFIADLATVVAGHNASATETLQIVDSVFGSLNRVRTALESLTIAEVVTFAGIWGRGLVESLLIADVPTRRVTLRRLVTELLRILESPTAASGFAMTASEALRIEEWAAWITGPHDPWEYWLDLRTGNLPVESTLDTPQAEACLDTPEAESCVDTPEAESELVGNTADSGLRYIDP